MDQFTVAACIKLSHQLTDVSDTPRLDIELLLTHILQKSRTYLFTWPDAVLTPEQSKRFEEYFTRRLTGEPIAHIIGVREFWSLPIAVNNSTLIPRPDTELLVEAALNIYAEDEADIQRHILDLGTGTGAIVLALATEKKNWICVGVDCECAAVELAEKNRQSLGLHNVRILQSDWFSSLVAENQYDVIISNPPYIDPNDPHLSQGDVRFEPLSALIAQDNGLADIKIICAESRSYLKQNGWLLIEHGYDQGVVVRNIFIGNHFKEVKTLTDLGGNERVTLGKANAS